MYACLSGKEFVSSAGSKGDVGVIAGSGRSPDGGNGSPLQYSCWEKSMDRGAWWARVHGAAEPATTERTHTHTSEKSQNPRLEQWSHEKWGKLAKGHRLQLQDEQVLGLQHAAW